MIEESNIPTENVDSHSTQAEFARGLALDATHPHQAPIRNIPEIDTRETVQWKDRVSDTNVNGAGRQKNSDWSNSVLRYVKPYVGKIGWKTQAVCKETLACMRLIADKYPEVQRVIECWDTYPYKQQTRIFSIDKACIEVSSDRDEFAGLVLAAVSKHIQRNAIAIIDQSFERIIQSAVDHAINGGAKGAQERIELIKLLTRPEKTSKPAATKTGPATSVPKGRAAQSLDSQLAELDDIENLGVGE